MTGRTLGCGIVLCKMPGPRQLRSSIRLQIIITIIAKGCLCIVFLQVPATSGRISHVEDAVRQDRGEAGLECLLSTGL